MNVQGVSYTLRWCGCFGNCSEWFSIEFRWFANSFNDLQWRRRILHVWWTRLNAVQQMFMFPVFFRDVWWSEDNVRLNYGFSNYTQWCSQNIRCCSHICQSTFYDCRMVPEEIYKDSMKYHALNKFKLMHTYSVLIDAPIHILLKQFPWIVKIFKCMSMIFLGCQWF